MKLKALQEKEIKSALEYKLKAGNKANNIEQVIENAKLINEEILKRSNEASLVITSLPPMKEGLNS